MKEEVTDCVVKRVRWGLPGMGRRNNLPFDRLMQMKDPSYGDRFSDSSIMGKLSWMLPDGRRIKVDGAEVVVQVAQ